MVYGFYFGRLAIRTMGVSAPQFFEFTIELPRLDIFATTSLTGVSLGMLHGTPGMTNAYIKRYGRINAGGSEEHFSPPATDVFFNSVYVAQCTYVNFRLAATQAESGMQGTVWVLSQRDSDSPQQSRQTMSHDFFDELGQQIGSHEFSVLTESSRVDVMSQIQNLRMELAQTRGLSAESIRVQKRAVDSESNIHWVGQ